MLWRSDQGNKTNAVLIKLKELLPNRQPHTNNKVVILRRLAVEHVKDLAQRNIELAIANARLEESSSQLLTECRELLRVLS